MGCEDFRVELSGIYVEFDEIVRYLLDQTYVVVDVNTTTLAEERYFLLDDSNHIIEIEVSLDTSYEKGIQISCRFALCQTASVDKVFIDFIKTIAADLGMEIFVAEDLPSGEKGLFPSPTIPGLDHFFEKAINYKRSFWISDFGPETAKLRSSEAIKKYLL